MFSRLFSIGAAGEADAKDKFGRTPLSYAAQKYHQDAGGTTPLIFAAMHLHGDIIDVLLDHPSIEMIR